MRYGQAPEKFRENYVRKSVRPWQWAIADTTVWADSKSDLAPGTHAVSISAYVDDLFWLEVGGIVKMGPSKTSRTTLQIWPTNFALHSLRLGSSAQHMTKLETAPSLRSQIED